MPTQIIITGESIQEESSNNQLQYQTQGEDEESGRVLRRERSPSRRAHERALMMAERKCKRDEAKEAQERKRGEYQERQRVAQARNFLQWCLPGNKRLSSPVSPSSQIITTPPHTKLLTTSHHGQSSPNN